MWIAVLVIPVALLALRLLDDSALRVVIAYILVAIGLAFVLVLAVAVVASGAGGLARGAVALFVLGLLTLPMLHVIGRRSCPELMGPDHGLRVSTQVFDAWRNREPVPSVLWASADLGSAWSSYVDGLALREYHVTGSGCWERLAPVAMTKNGTGSA